MLIGIVTILVVSWLPWCIKDRDSNTLYGSHRWISYNNSHSYFSIVSNRVIALTKYYLFRVILSHVSANQWGTIKAKYNEVKSIRDPIEGICSLFVQICQISFTYSIEPKISQSPGVCWVITLHTSVNGPNLLVS